ncbi:hypothetical protein [Pseudoalteromonas arctica]|uniref:Phage shock protein B n=1 Tax=Pseudoalteromonas arctica TaxID=394751 RepID=A0A7Y0DRC1_9GAMM|nr:hypothetical protein [Pseudoalteromonas arctica]NMM40245.1 hypothetical protein [Pseudoalteromonas arctica]
MSGTTMVVLIVFISVGFGVMYDMYKKHLEFKHRTLTDNKESNNQIAAVTAEMLALKERVQTLEAIVTDQSYSVKQEINKL